jgi:hypothetical protein
VRLATHGIRSIRLQQNISKASIRFRELALNVQVGSEVEQILCEATVLVKWRDVPLQSWRYGPPPRSQPPSLRELSVLGSRTIHLHCDPDHHASSVILLGSIYLHRDPEIPGSAMINKVTITNSKQVAMTCKEQNTGHQSSQIRLCVARVSGS